MLNQVQHDTNGNINTIFIDTTDNKKIMVGIRIQSKEFRKEKEVEKNRDQAMLPLIDKILKEHKLTFSDISSIEVNRGPGSFTGIKVGISVANALSFALKIPVNGKSVGEFVDGVYQ